MTEDKYYRYEEMIFTNSGVCLFLREFKVIKRTKCGVWIKEELGKKRFQIDGSYKKYACRTKEEALVSYRARKKKQIQILTARLMAAKIALIINPESEENKFLFLHGD